MDPSNETEHLQPSALGTRDYWDKTYNVELLNHQTNPSDIGTIWFSDSAAENKILTYLNTGIPLPSQPSFLDLGTGNGHLLFLLKEEGGFEGGRMLGVDYSAASVDLARSIAREKGLNSDRDDGEEEEGEEKMGDRVEFVKWDIMRDSPTLLGPGSQPTTFDVVLDKGTFDAISLSEEIDAHGRRICEGYRSKVESLVREGGYLLVTSCNWTENELRVWFEGPEGESEGNGELEYWGKIDYPSFSFGGKKGQTISSVCFRRKYEAS
ncbi:MAG: hypothetical protein M1827_004798 [Pycnora praestabilis]|nr:MAG: hypothetical protein M1827_004798 [Pycnora praestabilis]